MTSTISGVNALWSGRTVTVPFSFDTWDYGRVDIVVAGVQVASLVLPDFDEG